MARCLEKELVPELVDGGRRQFGLGSRDGSFTHSPNRSQLMPDEPRPRTRQEALELAVACMSADRPDRAEQLAARILRSNPADVEAAVILGQALLVLDRLDQGVAPLQKVARRKRDPRVLTLLAIALARTGQRAEATRLLRELLSEPLPFGSAVVELAELLGEEGRVAEAVDLLTRHSLAAPQDPLLHVALGYAHLRLGDSSIARKLFASVRQRFPQRADALVGLARAIALEGDHLGAARLYVVQLEARPHDIQSRLALSRSLLELGRRQDAETNLRAVAQGPPQTFGLAVMALADAPHGRLFLRPSAAAAFLGARLPNDARGSAADSDRGRDGPLPATRGRESAARRSGSRSRSPKPLAE